MIPRNNTRRRSHGFTLIELIVVVSLVGIMASIAIPSFASMIANSRVKGAASSLHMSLLKARSEAVQRNNSVRIMRNGSDWKTGWDIVLVSDSSVLGNERPAAGPTVTPSPSGLTQFDYLRSGRINCAACGAGEPKFTISAPNVTVRCVSISLSGMSSVKEGAC